MLPNWQKSRNVQVFDPKLSRFLIPLVNLKSYLQRNLPVNSVTQRQQKKCCGLVDANIVTWDLLCKCFWGELWSEHIWKNWKVQPESFRDVTQLKGPTRWLHAKRPNFELCCSDAWVGMNPCSGIWYLLPSANEIQNIAGMWWARRRDVYPSHWGMV